MAIANTLPLARQWLLTLLLGSIFYALSQGMVHFSDWCYLTAATVVAAGISAALVPLNRYLLCYLAASGPQWPKLGRWAWLLAGTLGILGLANLLMWPLLTWHGPGEAGPWGAAALVVTVAINWKLLNAKPKQLQ